MQTAHTPGPGKIDITEARARLIAAAPDLLAALEALVQWMQATGQDMTKSGGIGAFKYEGTEYSVVTEARAAIAKARAKE